jgi:hypothetical protein
MVETDTSELLVSNFMVLETAVTSSNSPFTRWGFMIVTIKRTIALKKRSKWDLRVKGFNPWNSGYLRPIVVSGAATVPLQTPST